MKKVKREIEIKETKPDAEYEVWDGKVLVGRIFQDDQKYQISSNGKDTKKNAKNFDDAINELLMDYNLHRR